MADVWAFPYLPLVVRVRVGPFDLVPRQEIVGLPAVEPWMLEQARLFLEFHRLPDDLDLGRDRVGGLVVPADGAIGGEVDPCQAKDLRLAVLSALLDANPATPPQGPFGTGACTSDNAVLYSRVLDPEGRVTTQYGLMSRRVTLGMTLGQSHVEPPLELTFPWMPVKFDEVYAAAVFAVLAGEGGSGGARSLALAIEWLDVAWRNTPSIGPQLRIVALKSAFEALLGVSDVEGGRREFGKLLDAPGATKTVREYLNKKKTKLERHELTDLEWWFTSLCFLRNKIAHAEEIPDQDWYHEGRHQVMNAETYVRRAIRRFVARRLPHEQPLDRDDGLRRQFTAAIWAARGGEVQ